MRTLDGHLEPARLAFFFFFTIGYLERISLGFSTIDKKVFSEISHSIQPSSKAITSDDYYFSSTLFAQYNAIQKS